MYRIFPMENNFCIEMDTLPDFLKVKPSDFPMILNVKDVNGSCPK